MELLPEGYEYMLLKYILDQHNTHVNLKQNFVLRPLGETIQTTTVKQELGKYCVQMNQGIQFSANISVTFELYIECYILAVAYNRMDRYFHYALGPKCFLGASSIAESDITPSQLSPNTHTVKSHKYQVDTAAWNCNCSVG